MNKETRRIALLEERCKMLRSICEFKQTNSSYQGAAAVLNRCINILLDDREYCFIWYGQTNSETGIIPSIAGSEIELDSDIALTIIQDSVGHLNGMKESLSTIAAGQTFIINKQNIDLTDTQTQNFLESTGSNSVCMWPLISHYQEYGVLVIHSKDPFGFIDSELDFIANVAADISLALYVDETAKRLRHERDFNTEIVTTVQALLVTLTPSGNILFFNQKAQIVSGYSEEQVKGKQWGDVLAGGVKEFKGVEHFAAMIREKIPDMNFQTELITKNGDTKTINWHSSIRADANNEQVGIVLFGIDTTSKVRANEERDNALDKWKNIFNAMQDPALVVSDQGEILDVNPATAVASQKTRSEIIGKSVCEILHGGRSPGAECPLELILKDKKNRVFETELRGLQGNYMMTISPLKEYVGTTGASLLLTRDLTEEQLMKAEALRAAQLASIGELAAGVAHEINNPINGIINYAQILKDTEENPVKNKFIERIIKESKRIAAITKNLLDFSRKREEAPEPVIIIELLAHCIDLVQHQYTLDGIIIEQHLPATLPNIFCNPQQLQQVFLNIFSNARYALNQRYEKDDAEAKLLTIKAFPVTIKNDPFVEIAIIDNGTGIEHEIIDRVMDPFFSTKTSGSGTGLGLSISHSLVQDNNGILRIQSELGKSTTLLIDLPTIDAGKGRGTDV